MMALALSEPAASGRVANIDVAGAAVRLRTPK